MLLQFWSSSRRRIYRVQQSLLNCSWRVISINPEYAKYIWVRDYSVPNWTHKVETRERAEAELRVYAQSRKLKKYE